jgi:hypothetical protein
VKLHGGDFDIRSRVGKGTRVIIRLPVNGERRRALEPEPAVSPNAIIGPTSADYRVKKIA